MQSYNKTSKTEDYIGQLLLNKLSQDDVIDSTFTEAKNVLTCVKNGFDFLDVFLRQCHPRFNPTPVVAEKIPSYSNSKDLHIYCKQVIDYYQRHHLSGIDFSELQISESYLYHLESSTYAIAREKAISKLDDYKLKTSTPEVPPTSFFITNLLGTMQTLHDKYGRHRTINNPYISYII